MFELLPLLMLALGGITVGKYAFGARTNTVSGRTMSRSYLRRLRYVLEQGMEPSDRLLECCMYEAVQHGREDLADAIWQTYYADGESPEDTKEIETDENSGQDDSITVSGKSSPIAGIDNQSWNSFVEKLATQEPGFATKKHVGRYHQSRERLAELGFSFDSQPDEETQYAALVSDITDAHEKCQKLVNDYLATLVTVDGEDHPITKSGILGLCKAAGVENAESWLSNPKDREKYPNTSKVFLATNGVF